MMLTGRLATVEDFEDYYFLKCDSDNILWSGHLVAPDKENLKEWYLNQLKRNDRYFFIFYDSEQFSHALGYLYMDVTGDNNDTLDIAHGVHSSCNGMGYGTKIIQFASNYTKNKMLNIKFIEAWIATDNLGSIKTFLKNDYTKTSESKLVNFANGDVKTFEKYTISLV